MLAVKNEQNLLNSFESTFQNDSLKIVIVETFRKHVPSYSAHRLDMEEVFNEDNPVIVFTYEEANHFFSCRTLLSFFSESEAIVYRHQFSPHDF
jgi:hypothetical protein